LKIAGYVDTKQNIVEYDQIGTVSEQDTDELIEFCSELKKDVLTWLQENHPELIEEDVQNSVSVNRKLI